MLALAGMIGGGKSTIAELIGKELGKDVFYESVEDNRILDKFYYDQKRWAFALQIYFLNNRFRAIKKALKQGNVILDRTLYEDVIFAREAYENGNMTEAEFDTYVDLLDNMMEETESIKQGKPELLIFLSGSFETFLFRIAKRGREYEQQQELINYYKSLYDRYQVWISDYDKSPVLKINIDHYDVTRKQDAKTVIELVKNKLSELS